MASISSQSTTIAECREWAERFVDDEEREDLGREDLDIEFERAVLDIVPTLLDEIDTASATLTDCDVPDGASLAERIAVLAKRAGARGE